MKTLNSTDWQEIFCALQKTMAENKSHLIELDATVGDGDLGLTMDKAFTAAYEKVGALTDTDIGVIFREASISIISNAPSTMGTLIGSGFMRAAKALMGKQEMNVGDLSEFFTQFVEGIMHRGKSKPGDKTIIDSLYPVTEALDRANNEHKSLQEAMHMAYEACEKGLENTKQMVPQHGKQVAHKSKSQGLIDPGAKVGFLMVTTMFSYIKK